MRSRTKPALAAALAASLLCGTALASEPSVADLDAAARAAGNRRDIAERIGDTVFKTRLPAEVSQISANELGTHLVVGVRIWGVKFSHPLTRDEFLDEVASVVTQAFGAAPAAEEVDVWASVPIDVSKSAVVSGDLAMPTSQTVFSITARPGESAAALRERASRSDGGAYWDEEWAHAAFVREA